MAFSFQTFKKIKNTPEGSEKMQDDINTTVTKARTLCPVAWLAYSVRILCPLMKNIVLMPMCNVLDTVMELGKFYLSNKQFYLANIPNWLKDNYILKSCLIISVIMSKMKSGQVSKFFVYCAHQKFTNQKTSFFFFFVFERGSHVFSQVGVQW